jgi:adenine-specific DNA methylase
MTWDFSECVILSEVPGSYQLCLNKILTSMETIGRAHIPETPDCLILLQSATDPVNRKVNAILTDPPYYDAIPYADLSDFFYVWLRRSTSDRFSSTFAESLTPKLEELVQHHKTGEMGRTGKKFYEKGMAESFRAAYDSLDDEGRMVIVFAHKAPEAWETLVKAMLEASLVVTASWPIDTEMQAGLKVKHAALATSLWMVCRKRPANARNGHYGKVKREMQERITERLRYFWDVGIRGPDFVWAAIGPALESYSSYKAVKWNTGEPFTVTEFLTEVRRIVTDFALGQILHEASTEALDEWTRYYLMHKDYFGTENAPVGECILLAQGYGVPLDDLRDRHIGILKKVSSGNALKLLGHAERTSDRIGFPHTSGRIPMIDMIHRVMKLWDANESAHINAYFHEHGLQENPLFKAVVQALIETSPQGSSDRSLLETLINYEPGEFSGTSYPRGTANETEQQLTMDDILSK